MPASLTAPDTISSHAPGAQAADQTSTSVLINPHSFRLSEGRNLSRVCTAAQAAGTPIHVVHGPDEIDAAVADCLGKRTERLVLIGGDGTVQAAVSALADSAAEPGPTLLVLGGGRTNFTARDLGTHTGLARLLKLVLDQPQAMNIERRQVLNLQQPGTNLNLCGFFVAGALVDHVIRDCHRYRSRHQGWLRTGHPSSAWRVTQLAVLGALGRSRYRSPTMTLDATGLGSMNQPVRILIASSLEHTRGRINPYAARGTGAVRLTAISASAERFWRTLPGLLRGRLAAALRAETGYLSGRAEEVIIRGLEAVCVDGQEYDLDPTLEVILRPGPEFRFLTA